MNRVLSLIGGTVLVLASASTVLGHADISGCDVILNDEESTFVDVYGPDSFDAWQTFDAPNGTVSLTDADGQQLAPGKYRAEWEDGTVETFTLSCDVPSDELIDPDYDPSATPAPDPTDEPVVEEKVTPPEPVHVEPTVTAPAILPHWRPFQFAS